MEASAAGQPAPAFQIVAQEPQMVIGPTGEQDVTWRITFTTPSGVRSWVNVPAADYNAETVARIVSENVATIEAVHKLGQAPTGP